MIDQVHCLGSDCTECRLREALAGSKDSAWRNAKDILVPMLKITVEMLAQCDDDLCNAYMAAMASGIASHRETMLASMPMAGNG